MTSSLTSQLYDFITKVSEIAILVLGELGKIFHAVLFDNLTIGGFLNFYLPSELNWIGDIASAVIPIPVLTFILTGIGLYYGITFVKWFLGLFH